MKAANSFKLLCIFLLIWFHGFITASALYFETLALHFKILEEKY